MSNKRRSTKSIAKVNHENCGLDEDLSFQLQRLHEKVLQLEQEGNSNEIITQKHKILSVVNALYKPRSLQSIRAGYELGVAYSDAKMYPQALGHLKGALEDYEHSLPSDNALLANILLALGNVYREQERNAEALSMYNRCVDEIVRTRGLFCMELIAPYLNIGLLYVETEEYDNALAFYKKALVLSESTLGGGMRITTANICYHIGALYERRSELLSAAQQYKKALALRRKYLGELHPDTAAAAKSLARIYKAQSKYTEAIDLLREALRTYTSMWGQRHIETLDARHDIGQLYFLLGKTRKSYVVMKELLTDVAASKSSQAEAANELVGWDRTSLERTVALLEEALETEQAARQCAYEQEYE